MSKLLKISDEEKNQIREKHKKETDLIKQKKEEQKMGLKAPEKKEEKKQPD